MALTDTCARVTTKNLFLCNVSKIAVQHTVFKIKKMKGNIIIAKQDLDILKKVCEDRFNGTYKVIQEHKLGYVISLDFRDTQDVFSLGRIIEQERLINT